MAPSTGSLIGIFHRDYLQRCGQGVGRAIGMVQTPSGVTGKGGAGYEDPERAVSGGGLHQELCPSTEGHVPPQ